MGIDLPNILSRLLVVAVLLLAGCTTRPEGGLVAAAPVVAHPPAGTRHAMNYLVVSRGGPAEGQDLYYFSGLEAGRISVSFLSQTRGRMFLSVTCDGRVRVRSAERRISLPGWTGASRALRFELAPAERDRTLLDLGPEVTRCDMTVTPGGYPPYDLRLRREEVARPDLARLDARYQGCTSAGLGADALAQAFWQADDLSMTCAVPIGPTRLLSDGLDALNAKVEALTGRVVSHEALLRGDPDMPLDWSNAPQLDLVYITYLNLNADFAGYLVARMLAWHAARGTIVRILVSDVMLTATDRALFEGLAARYPTVQIQPYRFPAEAADGFEDQLARLHRVTHVKLFGLIAREPGRSRAMIGGRNIHEGYFFAEPRDLSGYAFLHQYDPAQTRLTGGFTAYEDFEIDLRGDAATGAIMQHMAALWHRDHDTQSLRPAATTRTGSGAAGGRVRHFISVPFADGEAQVGYYARLFDAAQHSIRIAIPYLNLPPELDAALRRARARGVRVDVVTTVRVREATDFMVTGLNRAFANSFGSWVNFVDYDPFPRLLHSKLIVIDERLTVIASTNLNRRSFVHDLENGLVIMDRGVARGVSRIIQRYLDAGERVRPGQEISLLAGWLRRAGVIRRAF